MAYLYRSFSLTWPSAMQISWKKRLKLFRKEFNPLWIFSANQHGCRDAMWKRFDQPELLYHGPGWPTLPRLITLLFVRSCSAGKIFILHCLVYWLMEFVCYFFWQNFYLDLRRQHHSADSTPITTRQLESLIRLTQVHLTKICLKNGFVGAAQLNSLVT